VHDQLLGIMVHERPRGWVLLVASEARYPFQGPAAPNIQLPPIHEGFPLLLQSPYGSPKLQSLEKLPRCA